MPLSSGPGRLLADLARVFDRLSVKFPSSAPRIFLVTKVLAGRAKDIEDIRGVLAERGDRVLADQVRAVLTMLEQALGQSDLIPLFEREWERASRSTRA